MALVFSYTPTELFTYELYQTALLTLVLIGSVRDYM